MLGRLEGEGVTVMAKFVSDESVDEVVVSGSVWNCGELRATGSGLIGIVQNMNPVAIGQVATVKYRGQVEVTCSVAHTIGSAVWVNPSTQATATGTGAGFIQAGVARNATTGAGQTLLLDLNP